MMYSLPSNTKVWNIEKYQRLADIRNNPIAIEKKYMNDLLIQVNMNLKMMSVVNNGAKLEEFCFSPLVYPHEVICKDMRILFTTKSQKDGCMSGKFRVRFRCLENCQNFCSFLSNFLNILMYEDLQRRDSQNPNFSLSASVQNVPSSSLMTNEPMYDQQLLLHHQPASTTPRSLNRSFGESSNRSFNADASTFFDSSMPVANESTQFSRSFSEAALNNNVNSRSAMDANFLNRSMAESTKSWADNKEAFLRVSSKVGMDMETQTEPISVVEKSAAGAMPAVNINIGTLISDAAMSKFTSMCESFFGRLFSLLANRGVPPRNNNPPPPQIQQAEDEHEEMVLPPTLGAAAPKRDRRGRPVAKKNPPKSPTAIVKKKKSFAHQTQAQFELLKRDVPHNRKPSKHYSLRGAPPVIESMGATDEADIFAVDPPPSPPPAKKKKSGEKGSRGTAPPVVVDSASIASENENQNEYLGSQLCWY